MDTSIPLRRGDEIITRGRRRERSRWETEGTEKRGQDQVWKETGEKPRGPGESMEI